MKDTMKTSQNNLAKLAGWGYLLSLIIPTLSATQIFYKLIVPDNASATAGNIMANLSLFRIGVVSDLLIALNILFLAVVLIAIFKPISKNLTRLVFAFKIGEATLVGIAAGCGLMTLGLINDTYTAAVFTPVQFQALVALFAQAREVVFSIALTFLGVGMTVFCYLFYKANYIPRFISALGMFAYGLLFVYSFVGILAPEFAKIPLVQTVIYAPSCVFELIIGLWLLLKGMVTHS